MKKITLKRIEIMLDGKLTPFSYNAQLQEIMRTPSDPSRGADFDEVRRSIRVLDALEKAPAPEANVEVPFVELEDADFEYMKKRVLAARWPFNDKFVVTFVEDVTQEQPS